MCHIHFMTYYVGISLCDDCIELFVPYKFTLSISIHIIVEGRSCEVKLGWKCMEIGKERASACVTTVLSSSFHTNSPYQQQVVKLTVR